MTTKYKCWMPEYDEREDDALEIDKPAILFSPEDIASKACNEWLSRGKFSGDPIPNEITVHVRTPDGDLFEAKVEPSYEVTFYSYVPAKKLDPK